jgi:hypothetical protein
MPRHNVFELRNSDLNAFLFAEVGTEPNGMILTVVSVIARRDEDPWKEARRLASLPKASAANHVAQVIAQMPRSPWSPAEAAVISARLIPLLPTGSGAVSLSPALPFQQFNPRGPGMRILVSILFLAYLVFSLQLQKTPAVDHTKTAARVALQAQSPGALESLTPVDIARATTPQKRAIGPVSP